MEALEASMKKNNMNIDSSSSSSHGHALYAFGFSFNEAYTSSFDEWLIHSRLSYHVDKDKNIFSTLNECNTKKKCVGDDRSLIVEASRIVHVDNGHLNHVVCIVPSLSYNLISVY
jgi:hypothetical protein